jgi:hypothetical protein
MVSSKVFWLSALLATSLVACGSETDPVDVGSGNPPTENPPTEEEMSPWTEAECNQDMDHFVAAGCQDASMFTALKSSCAMLMTSMSSALCEEPLSRADAAHDEFQSAQLFCSVGQTDTDSTSAVNVLLGVLCVTTVNNVNCAGMACNYDADCPNGYGCNSATDYCVKDNAACVGLPCEYNADCPNGMTCNSATEQCSGD